MKFRFFSAITLSTIGIALFYLTACNSDSTPPSKKEMIRLATSADNPPFEFHQTTTNKITGFDIELAYALAEELKVDLQIQDMDFVSIIPALLSGRADFAMATLSVTKEREKIVIFSDAYYTAQPTSISLKTVTFSQPKHFEGKNVGVQLGSSYEQMMKKIAQEVKDIKLHPLNKIGEIIQELKTGRIDVAVIDIEPAKAYIKNNKDLHINLLEGYQESYAIAFSKNSIWAEKFNQVLITLKKNGKLDKLIAKWFANNVS